MSLTVFDTFVGFGVGVRAACSLQNVSTACAADWAVSQSFAMLVSMMARKAMWTTRATPVLAIGRKWTVTRSTSDCAMSDEAMGPPGASGRRARGAGEEPAPGAGMRRAGTQRAARAERRGQDARPWRGALAHRHPERRGDGAAPTRVQSRK